VQSRKRDIRGKNALVESATAIPSVKKKWAGSLDSKGNLRGGKKVPRSDKTRQEGRPGGPQQAAKKEENEKVSGTLTLPNSHRNRRGGASPGGVHTHFRDAFTHEKGTEKRGAASTFDQYGRKKVIL